MGNSTKNERKEDGDKKSHRKFMKCMEYLEKKSCRDEENSIEKMSENRKIRNSMKNYEKNNRAKRNRVRERRTDARRIKRHYSSFPMNPEEEVSSFSSRDEGLRRSIKIHEDREI